MTTQNEQWQQVKDLTSENLDELLGMDHQEIKEFASKHGLMTKSGFPKFKAVLKTKGIDYEALRMRAHDERERELEAKAETLFERAADGPEIQLASAAVEKGGRASFAVVDQEDRTVWYGRLFDNDHIWTAGDPASAEQSAADKAVWIAGKAIAASGAQAGRLTLSVTHPSLDFESLVRTGIRHDVALTVAFDEINAAVGMAETPGYQKWQEYDLAQLVGGEQ